MKVLLVSPQPPPYGGIANWSKMILEYASHTEDVLRTINIAPKKRSTEGRNLFDRVFVSGIEMFAKRRELKKEIKNNRPDVIHMTTSGSLAIIRDILLLKTAKKYGVPTVYHIRFGKTNEMAENNTRMWPFFKKAMLLASTVIAIDKRTFDAIKKYVPEANVVLLPNPVDVSRLPKYSGETKKQVVFLGWVVKTKGVEELIEAWNTIGNEYSDYNLVVIGQAKPEYFTVLKAMVKADNVCFVGEMAHDDAMQTLAESSVFVLPSYTEGFPNSVVEAMALGKAIVASDVGAIPEMLDGECGIVIKPQNQGEIVEALRKIISDEAFRERISENAYEKAYSEYSLERVYKCYKELWGSVKGI